MDNRLLCLLGISMIVLALLQPPTAVCAKSHTGGFGGIEFFGSSMISRLELEKDLGLRQGASLESTIKAADRLKSRLQRRNLDAAVDVVKDGDNCYVTVDIIEPGATGIPVRKLDAPHTVYLTSDLPFNLLGQLFARIEELSQQGRPIGERVENGIKVFLDEPCNQYAKKLSEVVPLMRGELLQVINSDPDPNRRARAIECLSWDSRPVQDCLSLMPIIDDGAEEVRASVARYIFPRLSLLPDNFPIEGLIEGFSHQLSRPSHMDRSLALRCLEEIVRTHPFTGRAVQEAVADKVKQLESQTLLNSIKQPAEHLLYLTSHAPAIPQPKPAAHLNEF